MGLKNDFLQTASLGIEIAAAVFLGAFIGYQIDLYANSRPKAMVAGLIIGGVVGMWNVVKIALKNNDKLKMSNDK
ncbi:MAG: AtpZ/AtpI family protein [Candidatus Margulisbacteria bacterium]|nr:AtpZ/AtpI family protein [Candidatus Margulisiibacteriota bacterium]